MLFPDAPFDEEVSQHGPRQDALWRVLNWLRDMLLIDALFGMPSITALIDTLLFDAALSERSGGALGVLSLDALFTIAVSGTLSPKALQDKFSVIALDMLMLKAPFSKLFVHRDRRARHHLAQRVPPSTASQSSRSTCRCSRRSSQFP